MNGLKKKIKNKQACSKHIIENMIYMVELNPSNVKICKKIFKNIDSNSKPNIQKVSYFDFKPHIRCLNISKNIFTNYCNLLFNF